WNSHGCRYGIGIEIDQWLARGLNVVVNGSRAYLHQARASYPRLLAVKITVSDAVLEQRLNNRGRETTTDIRTRLKRADDLDRVQCPGLEEIGNDGRIEVAGDALLALCASAGREPL
ncbi:MAG: phosphonate metabolism protein/1,5-bisphosphokinase (PRPP-forming) PhnN, partial [Gammaproteobacteria bacterium]|nr:phosphonate metabolism protein/1,5-bisphosphokinase (PRPP-forming) PhnN [Gammaproteobacteria bacterium]